MGIYAQSDLACEFFGRVEKTPAGVVMQNEQIGGISVDRLKITDANAAEKIGRPIGKYVTFRGCALHLLSETDEEGLIRLLIGELRGMATQLTEKRMDRTFSVFVVGLGNDELTSDAIGPWTVRRLHATRHLQKETPDLYRDLNCCALSIMAPGVLGKTGIETAEVIKGTVDSVKPDLVILIDALAARDCAHLSSTVQISNVGIYPGSGVGNHRAAIDRQSLGVPVISVGIPTVVRSSTLVYDALRKAGILEPPSALVQVLESGKNFFVSSKESDSVLRAGARILSRAISLAFTEGLSSLYR